MGIHFLQYLMPYGQKTISTSSCNSSPDSYRDRGILTLKHLNIMNEIFDIIKAVNNLKDQVTKLTDRIDYLFKFPQLIASDQTVKESIACKLLHVSRTEIIRMRKNNEITFIRHHRKILYPMSAINKYLDERTVQAKERA